MLLEVEIGATIRSWNLGADDSLDIWVRQCPWRGGEVSQIRVIGLASHSGAERVMLELRRLVYAADEGVYSPRVLVSDHYEVIGMAEAMTACIFGEPRRIDALSLKRLILDRLDQAPHVFQIVDRSDDHTELLKELRTFIEDINRQESVYPLIVIVLSDSAPLSTSPDFFNTVPAMPAGRVLNPKDLDPAVTWGNYLHSRAAWECGGDMNLAQMYGAAWKVLPPFDDDALEESCQSLAKWRWENLDTNRDAELRQYYVDASSSAQKSVYGDNLEELIRDRLLWRPPGYFRVIPTAWAVRANANERWGNGVLQRAALVNGILVAELLAWCFQLETLERSRFFDESGLDDSDEAQFLYANFVEKRPYSAAALYPNHYPFSLSIPDFESFGGFCNRFGKNPRIHPRRLLLSLRNTLCHGHYAGWRTIGALLEIHSRLSLTSFSS
jgi:hypothetical protein